MQHDVVLGDREGMRSATRSIVRSSSGSSKGVTAPHPVAHQVVVVLAARQRDLVARRAIADLQARDSFRPASCSSTR
jgi:hypothetical protein